ncbi:hypothetical protein ACFL41_01995 [Gemmatimonadota bacterium]
MPDRTDAEHRALDERLNIITWGCALLVMAILFLLPGVSRLWHFLVPVGIVFVGMSAVRKVMVTRRDLAAFIAGCTALGIGLLDLVGVDLQFFPLVPVILILVGVSLILSALLCPRLRTDPTRHAEGED